MSGEEAYPAVEYLCERGLEDLSREEAVAILGKFEHEIGTLVSDIGLPGYRHVCNAVKETRYDLERSEIEVEDVDTTLREHVDENDPSLLLLMKTRDESTLNAIASEFQSASENADSLRETTTVPHHPEEMIEKAIRKLDEFTDEDWSPSQIEFQPQTGTVVPPDEMDEDSRPAYRSAVQRLSMYTPFVEEPIFDRTDEDWSVEIFVEDTPDISEENVDESEFESLKIPDLSREDE